ncbi:hypothetical protein AnigIFM50267_007202 [Aspergillus niger]|nr:hypothetical protein AnigIFM50267_007202 [Aspergillus niger]
MSSPKRRIETDVMKYALDVRTLPRIRHLSYSTSTWVGMSTQFRIWDRSTDFSGTCADVSHRLMSDYEVTLVNDNSKCTQSFATDHRTLTLICSARVLPPFAGGHWKIHVELPDQYPYKSPSIGFVNRIFHPNIDELSGSVCLDVINQTWSPMYDMINIFEVFLPQLLRYPNPSDPLNGEAAAMLMREPKSYEAKVKEYVAKYASKEAVDEAGEDTESEDELSSAGSYESGGEEPAGTMDDV